MKCYPDFVKGYQGGNLLFADGTRMPYDDGREKSFVQKLDDSDPEDMFAFITALGLEKPVFYGFSDGGVTGLILASRYPELLSALIVSGASLRPDSTKDLPLRFFRLWSHVDRSDKMRIMLREPDITDDMLRSIAVPAFVTAGEKDVIKESHTRHIAETIPGASLKIFPKAGHTGYIMRSTKIADYILSVIPE